MKPVIASLIADWKRLEKLHDAETDNNASKARRDKARNDANYLCLAIEKSTHELHCLAVEGGIADRRPGIYGVRMVSPDSWHTFKENYREPKTGA